MATLLLHRGARWSAGKEANVYQVQLRINSRRRSWLGGGVSDTRLCRTKPLHNYNPW